MVDEVFNLSLHTMTIHLHSREGDLVHLTTSLEFLVVDKLLRVIASDCFWLVAPKSDRVEDVWKNVPACFLDRITRTRLLYASMMAGGTVSCSWPSVVWFMIAYHIITLPLIRYV
jgi:hypothetical protein